MSENSPTDWRDRAIGKSLSVTAQGSGARGLLLKQILRHRPGCHAVLLSLDRAQLMRFLGQQTGLQSLLSGTCHLYDDAANRDFRVYAGWYEIAWEGTPVEVALTPNLTGNGSIICAADREEPPPHCRRPAQRIALHSQP